jgi:hypothetical protein
MNAVLLKKVFPTLIATLRIHATLSFLKGMHASSFFSGHQA